VPTDHLQEAARVRGRQFRRELPSGLPAAGLGNGGCCDANQTPRSHDTSRIPWAKLMARVGEEFPLQRSWVWR